MTSPGTFLALAVLAILGLLITILVFSVRLLFRLADRGARRALQSLTSASRGLFGPGGPPDQIARRLRDRYPELSPGRGTGLAFSHLGRIGRLDFISNLTEIRFDLGEGSKHHVEVSTPSFLTQLAEDDPEAFRVRGSEDLYQELFKDSPLGPMLRAWNVSFEWIVRPGEYFLQIRSLPRNEEELWRWLKGAFALLQSIPGIGGVTTLPVARISPATLATSVCQICGASLGQNVVVYCVRCATPHHEDCWAYVGECSTFACRERRYAR
jgi:hypothetical protein